MLVLKLLSPLSSSQDPKPWIGGPMFRVGLPISGNLIKNLPGEGEQALVL